MKKSLGQLLEEAILLQKAARLTKQFDELNFTILQILHEYLDKVQVQFAPSRPNDWDNHLSVLEVVYGGIILKMPVPELRTLDRQLVLKVRMKMENQFTNDWCVFNIDGETRICPPSKTDMIPYADSGYWGGIYWAQKGATYATYEAAGKGNDLYALGWDEVEKACGIPLRKIMARAYDGYDGGFYWLINPAENPIADMKALLARRDQEHAEYTSEQKICEYAGNMLWVSENKTAWWTCITLELSDGTTKTYGVNHRTEFKDGSLACYSPGWGRTVRYRPIPGGVVDETIPTIAFLDLFCDEAYRSNIQGFVKVRVEEMGGDDGLEILEEREVKRTDVIARILAEDYIKKNRTHAGNLRAYLEEK